MGIVGTGLLREFYGIADRVEPTPLEHLELFLQQLELRRERRKPIVIIIDGRETGVGKSTLALRIARRLDPRFSLDNVVYRSSELHELYSSRPAGTIALWDESVLGLLSRKGSRDEELAGIIGAISIVRKNGIGTILTVPKIRMLDTLVYNGLAPFWLFVEERGRARVHRAFKGAQYRSSQRMLPYDRWESVSPIGWKSMDRDPFFQRYNERAIARNREYFLEQKAIADAKRDRLLGIPRERPTRSTESRPPDTGPDRAMETTPPPPPPLARSSCRVPGCSETFARSDNRLRHERSAHLVAA